MTTAKPRGGFAVNACIESEHLLQKAIAVSFYVTSPELCLPMTQAQEPMDIDPTALRNALQTMRELDKAEKRAEEERHRQYLADRARERAKAQNDAKAKLDEAFAAYDAAAKAVREAVGDALAAARELGNAGADASMYLPAAIYKVHAPSMHELVNCGWTGFSTTEQVNHAMLAEQMRRR
jgi:hypothetical protein